MKYSLPRGSQGPDYKFMKEIRKYSQVFLFFLFIFTNSFVLNGELFFTGKIDLYSSFRLNDSVGILVSKNIFDGNLSIPVGSGNFNLSVRGIQRGLIKPFVEGEIREAFLDYSFGDFEIRAGRQIFSWGKLERTRIADIVSPLDLREYIAYDYEDLRMGVDAVQLIYFSDRIEIDFIWIPIFKSTRLPLESSKWNFGFPFYPETKGENIDLRLPSRNIKNSELFLKAALSLEWIDLELFGFSAFNDFPEVNGLSVENGESVFYGEFHRLTGVGIEFEKPVDFVILKGEVAFVNGNRLIASDNTERIKSDILRFGIGADIQLRGELVFSIQLTGNKLFGDMDLILPGQLSETVSFKVSKKFFRNRLDFSAYSLKVLKGNDFYVRVKSDLSLSDDLHLIVGSDIFSGDGELFGLYKKNSQFWIKLRYMF